MKHLFTISSLLIALSFSTFVAADQQPAQKKKIVRNLQTKAGKKIKTKSGQIVKVKQSGFHKSLG